MANETRPRRESSGTSRLRKSIPPPLRPSPTRPPARPPPRPRPIPDRGCTAPAAEPPYRDRPGREPYREEGPADREPIRFIREREPCVNGPSESQACRFASGWPAIAPSATPAPSITRGSPSTATAIGIVSSRR